MAAAFTSVDNSRDGNQHVASKRFQSTDDLYDSRLKRFTELQIKQRRLIGKAFGKPPGEEMFATVCSARLREALEGSD